jgi:hypothetical protein
MACMNESCSVASFATLFRAFDARRVKNEGEVRVSEWSIHFFLPLLPEKYHFLCDLFFRFPLQKHTSYTQVMV